MTIKVAFYTGNGGLLNKTIRWGTNSQVSHVELVDHDDICWSSSHTDGGVRRKKINLKSGNWKVIPVAWADDKAVDFVRNHLDAKYDYMGVLLSHVVSLHRHSKDKWFCSEIVAASLGLINPHSLSPAHLESVIKMLNAVQDEHWV